MSTDQLLIEIKNIFENSMDKMEKKFDEKLERSERRTGDLIEGLRDDIKAVAEGHSILNNKLDKIEGDVQELKTDVQDLKLNIKGLRTDMTSLKSDMAVAKEYVIKVDNKLSPS